MWNRLTYDFVKGKFTERGYELLEENYINNQTKMKYRCPKHSDKELSITYGNLSMGKGCPYCSGVAKYTYEQVKKEFENCGYNLLSDTYKSNLAKLRYICPKHPDKDQKMSISNLIRGQRCSYCSGVGVPIIDEIRDVFSQNGCILLSKEYVNARTKLEYICACGNMTTTIWNNFKKSKRCLECGNDSSKNKRKTKYDDVYEYFSSNGCRLLSTTYNNQEEKLKYICICGNQSEITFKNFKKGSRCKDCGLSRIRQHNIERRHSYEFVKRTFENNGCILITKNYKKASQKLTYICKCGTKSRIRFTSFLKGTRCKQCGNQQRRESLYLSGTAPCSRQQKHLHSVIGGELNYPYKSWSLDIAFPKEKIYLEYNGGGHELAVKFEQITKEEFDKKQRARWYALYRDGWKEIRISTINDYLPSEDKLREMLDFTKATFKSGRSWIEFDLDKGIYNNKENKNKKFDFGKLYQLPRYIKEN